MASVSSSTSRSNDSYEAERASLEESHSRAVEKMKSDEEKTLSAAKEEYQEHLRSLREKANEDIRRQKEETYNASGKRFAEAERENLNEQRRLKYSYEDSLKKENDMREQQARNYEERLENALSDSNERTSSQIQQQKREFTRLSQEKDAQNREMQKYYETELAAEKKQSQKNTEQIVKDNQMATDKAMDQRSEVYREHIKYKDEKQKYELAERDKTINELQNTSDPQKMSPLARKVLEDRYQAQMQKEVDLNKEMTDKKLKNMQESNAKFQNDSRNAYSEKFAEESRDLNRKHLMEKQYITKNYNDLEARTQMNQVDHENTQRAASQRAYQKHTQEMDLQQKKFHDQLQNQRLSSEEEKMQLKDEFENKQRDQDREWFYKMSDSRRALEKKIIDQEDAHARETSEMRFQFDKKLQEQDMAAKRLLDDRVKAYESQLKQQEVTHKERQRFLTEHYEEELDKLKRTNARLSQQKS